MVNVVRSQKPEPNRCAVSSTELPESTLAVATTAVAASARAKASGKPALEPVGEPQAQGCQRRTVGCVEARSETSWKANRNGEYIRCACCRRPACAGGTDIITAVLSRHTTWQPWVHRSRRRCVGCQAVRSERMSAAKGKAPASDISTRPTAAVLPPDGGHPAVRGAGQRSLHTRADAGPGPPLHRRRGHRRRRLRGAAQRRLRDQHPPRPRPLPGQGRVAEPDVRRAARQGSRLLQGQGRVDAHRRPRHRQPGRQRHRRRQRRHRHGRGLSRRSTSRPAGWRCASSARARWGRGCCTRR